MGLLAPPYPPLSFYSKVFYTLAGWEGVYLYLCDGILQCENRFAERGLKCLVDTEQAS